MAANLYRQWMLRLQAFLAAPTRPAQPQRPARLS